MAGRELLVFSEGVEKASFNEKQGAVLVKLIELSANVDSIRGLCVLHQDEALFVGMLTDTSSEDEHDKIADLQWDTQQAFPDVVLIFREADLGDCESAEDMKTMFFHPDL